MALWKQGKVFIQSLPPVISLSFLLYDLIAFWRHHLLYPYFPHISYNQETIPTLLMNRKGFIRFELNKHLETEYIPYDIILHFQMNCPTINDARLSIRNSPILPLLISPLWVIEYSLGTIPMFSSSSTIYLMVSASRSLAHGIRWRTHSLLISSDWSAWIKTFICGCTAMIW